MTTLQTPLALAATASASATLVAGKHTPVDATSGAKTMTLPTPVTVGARLRVEKVDTSANAVTISGTIRGGAGTITLTSQYETQELFAESLTSWRVASSHRTKAATDAAYDATGAAASAQAFAVQRANHTGAQSATTITGLSAVATTGAYGDLSGKPIIERSARNLPGYWVSAYGGAANLFDVMGAGFTSGSTVVQNHQIAADCTDLRIVLPFGWRMNNNTAVTDQIFPNSTPVKVALQVGTAFYPVTFGGSRAVTCDPAGRLISDPIGGFWAKGTQIKVRVLNGSINGAQYPNTQPATGPGIAPAFSGNSWTQNTDIVDAATVGANTNPSDNLWGASLLGRPATSNPFILGAVGDSITDGTGDTGGVGFSWLSRATNATVPLFRNTRSGLTAQGVAAMAYYSMPLLGGCSHVVVFLGANDLSNNRTLAQMQADLTAIYRAVAGEGAKVIGVTVSPKTTSTDSWATTANQTASGADYTGGATSIRAQLNNWIRGGGGGLLAGFIEVADAVETARDSGIWKANYSVDGLHPTSTGHIAMAGAVNLTALAAL